MKKQYVWLAIGLVAVVAAIIALVLAQGDDAEDESTSTSTTTSTAVASTTTQSPGSSTTSTAATTSSAEATTTTGATESTTTVAVTTSAAPLVIDLTSGATTLLGVEIGTDAETAIDALEMVLGPGEDFGWDQGCPLDGEEENERRVSWGSLTANLYRESDGTETFISFTYRPDFDSGTALPGGPGLDQILLPGNAHPGDAITIVADAVGGAVEYDDVFDVYRVVTEALEVLADTEAGPINNLGVPFIPACE